MQGEVTAAIIAAIASVLTLLAKHWLDERDRDLVTASRRAALTGAWHGGLERVDTPPGEEIQVVSVELTFGTGRRAVRGTGSFTVTFEGHDVFVPLTFEGGFRHDAFLEVQYKSADAKRLQFGSVIMELSADGKQLKGAYAGFGSIADRIVLGRIILARKDQT
jgi:hypothetical protein